MYIDSERHELFHRAICMQVDMGRGSEGKRTWGVGSGTPIPLNLLLDVDHDVDSRWQCQSSMKLTRRCSFACVWGRVQLNQCQVDMVHVLMSLQTWTHAGDVT